jgi:hypothetical protein
MCWHCDLEITLKAKGSEKCQIVTRSWTVESSMLKVPFQLQVQLVASGFLKSHRIRWVKFDPEAKHQIVCV